jgi:hypothetical protein
MRPRALVMAAVLLTTLPLHTALAAEAEWKEYRYPDLGFAVNFPGEVKTSKGELKGTIAGTVSTTVMEADFDNIEYRAAVVDFSTRVPELVNILGETAYNLTVEGHLLADSVERTETGKNAIYGRRIAVTLKDGSKKISEVYAKNGKLYIFTTTLLPKADQRNPIAARFDDSILFDLERDISR